MGAKSGYNFKLDVGGIIDIVATGITGIETQLSRAVATAADLYDRVVQLTPLHSNIYCACVTGFQHPGVGASGVMRK
jgi:hypothetical protein